MRCSPPRARRRGAATAAQPESADAAYAAAVKRLAQQPQSSAMLAHKLARAGYAPVAIEAALARATADGYLDDDAYARALVRRRQVGRGRAMIAQELRAKGIGGGVLEQALSEADPADEAQRARVIARAIVRLKPPADRAQLRATVGARLGRRGFSSGVISRVLRELAAELTPVRAEQFDTPSEPD